MSFGDECVRTNFTSVVHNDTYPSISPSRPELSQKGRTVLVTGATGNIGSAITKGFLQTHPARLIPVGRSREKLDGSVAELKEYAKTVGATDTVISGYVADLADTASIDALWKSLTDDGIIVDVLVHDAAVFNDGFKTLLEMGRTAVWDMFESNVRSTLWLVDHFSKQGGSGKVSLSPWIPPFPITRTIRCRVKDEMWLETGD
jgi:NAD(P)-dependent dehydrogenase (short-subunit alcohol dehydrogenase family)